MKASSSFFIITVLPTLTTRSSSAFFWQAMNETANNRQDKLTRITLRIAKSPRMFIKLFKNTCYSVFES
jgi:hypothetical protein